MQPSKAALVLSSRRHGYLGESKASTLVSSPISSRPYKYTPVQFDGRLLFFLVQTFVKVNNNGEIMYLRRNKRSQAASRYSTL